MSKIILAEQASAPDTPGSGKVAVYVDANGDLAWKDDNGYITKIASAGAYTLTVAASGTAALLATAQTWTATQTFTSPILANGALRVLQISIADDAIVDLVATYAVPAAGLLLYQISTTSGYSGVVSYRAASSPYCQVAAQYGSSTVVGTTELTAGTSDGTDAAVNVAATSDGKLIVKNRTGGTRTFTLFVLGG